METGIVMRKQLGLIHKPNPRISYVGASLGGRNPPASADWHRCIQIDGDALGNDAVGNCVECGTLRAIQIMRAISGGDIRKPTKEQALALYSAWAGYDGVPGGPKDLGTCSDTAANIWSSAGVKWGDLWVDIPTIVSLNPKIITHLKTAVAYLGPIQLDLNMPLSAQTQAVWDVDKTSKGQAGSWGAHRVCVGKYDDGRIYCITWGGEQPMTEAFVETYAIEATASLSESWFDTVGMSPVGKSASELASLSRNL